MYMVQNNEDYNNKLPPYFQGIINILIDVAAVGHDITFENYSLLPLV